MAPFERITSDRVIRAFELVGGVGFGGLGLWLLSLGLDGHPDPLLYGTNSYIVQGFVYPVFAFVYSFGLCLARARRSVDGEDRI